MSRQSHGKRDPTAGEVILRHERYIEGLIDGAVNNRDDFRGCDIRAQLMRALEDLRFHLTYLSTTQAKAEDE